MTRDTLSKREDRALHQALASVVLTQFPNPQRKDCPETSVLLAIAKKHIPMRDPAHEHVGSCSPCFSELTEIRDALHRRNMMWAMGTAGTTVLVLAVLVAYFAFLRVGSPVRQEAVQPRSPVEIPQIEEPNRSLPPSQPGQVAAMLDLRNASVTRTVQPSRPTSNMTPIEIPRGLLALTIQLPIGSEAGSYEVEIRKANQPAIQTVPAQADIEGGITKLLLKIDTTSIEPGEYDFTWRLTNFAWRHHPIVVR
jgi:hypothetical protein